MLGTQINYNKDINHEPIQHYLARKISPSIPFFFEETTFDGKRIVVLSIPAAKIVPADFGGIRFIRIGLSVPSIVDSIIESKRRNPIIADLFHRLKLMNRRGSGLANITNKSNDLFNDNHNHVFFESNDEFFIVKIQNANYGVKNETKNDTRTDTLNKKENLIINIMRNNPYVTINEISKELKYNY